MRQVQCVLILCISAMAMTAEPAGNGSTYWRDYRGPGREGIYDETPILTEWAPEGLTPVWKTAVGPAYSGIIVADGKVFTIEQRDNGETVAAYDLESGEEVWAVTWEGKYGSFLGGKGPRATPVWDEGRLYAQGALGELKCLDAADGELIWARNIVEENGGKNARWGTAVSPLIYGDLLIAAPGGGTGSSVVAYNKTSGERAWSALDDKPSYASPMAVTLGGVEQVLIVNAGGAYGLTPAGEELWHFPWKTSHNVNAAQPLIVGDNRFVISSGYGNGAALVELVGGLGALQPEVVWETNFLKNKFSTSVIHDGHIYGLDEKILTCIDLETGAQKWKAGRYGHGQVLLADGHLIISAETGEAVLVKATPEGHEEVARFQAVEGKTWNTPALAGGRLLIRSQEEMACFRIAP